MFKKEGLAFMLSALFFCSLYGPGRLLAQGGAFSNTRSALRTPPSTEVSFIARREVDVGARPVSAAVGDFNGDGIPDLAVSNNGSSSVSIRLGNGDGTFRPARDFAMSANPGHIVTADFNGDQKLDLALGNGSLLLGNGDGTFRRGPEFTALGALAVGDFNGDSIPDLAVANSNSNGVAVLLGVGDGTFGSRQMPVGRFPIAVAVGDFNGDGFQDLVTANWGDAPQGTSTISVLLGRGDGTFAPAQDFGIGNYPSSITAADFDGDEIQDVAVTSSTLGTVSVLLANGDGTFQAAVNVAALPDSVSITCGDFDGDSIPDLAVIYSGNVRILLGNGDGTFRSAQDVEAGWGPTAISVGDFNGDNIPDLAVTNQGDYSNMANSSVSILLGRGDGTFRSTPSLAVGNGPQSVTTGDFNGDGTTDLAVANSGTDRAPDHTISILMGNGDGTFQNAQSVRVGRNPSAIVAGDFNGDAVPDLAVAHFDTDNVSVLIGNGDGTFVPDQILDVGMGPRSVVTADLNGDAVPDLVVANYRSNDVSLLLGNGDGRFQAAQTIEIGSRHWSAAVGDFDGDGAQDLAVTNEDTGNVSVLMGNGDGTFRSAENFAVGVRPRAIAVGDFNGDRVQDLAVANWGAYNARGTTISILMGNGDGTFRSGQSATVPGSPSSIAVGDFNGDAIQDLAVTNWGFMADRNTVIGFTLSVLIGNGDGTFQATPSFGVRFHPSSVVAGDFNGDGLPDLAVTNAGSNNASVLLNDTPP